jgi:hypothetical protein
VLLSVLGREVVNRSFEGEGELFDILNHRQVEGWAAPVVLGLPMAT